MSTPSAIFQKSAYVVGLLLEGVADSDRHDVVMEHALGVCPLLRQGSGRARAPFGAERIERMRRLRLIGDLIAAGSVETCDNRSARRRYLAQAMATRSADIFPLVLGMFAGPETIPAQLVNDTVLDRIRAA